METTFENAKVGDKVWSIQCGWGRISEILPGGYPITVEFNPFKCDGFTYCGKFRITDNDQSLFWDEVKIEAPVKPKKKLEQLTITRPYSDMGTEFIVFRELIGGEKYVNVKVNGRQECIINIHQAREITDWLTEFIKQ